MKRSFYRVLCCLTLLLASCALLAVGASAADPVRDFDFARYASDNPDLMRAYGPELYQDELYQHSCIMAQARGGQPIRCGRASPLYWRRTPSRPTKTSCSSPAPRRGWAMRCSRPTAAGRNRC